MASDPLCPILFCQFPKIPFQPFNYCNFLRNNAQIFISFQSAIEQSLFSLKLFRIFYPNLAQESDFSLLKLALLNSSIALWMSVSTVAQTPLSTCSADADPVVSSQYVRQNAMKIVRYVFVFVYVCMYTYIYFSQHYLNLVFM